MTNFIKITVTILSYKLKIRSFKEKEESEVHILSMLNRLVLGKKKINNNYYTFMRAKYFFLLVLWERRKVTSENASENTRMFEIFYPFVICIDIE